VRPFDRRGADETPVSRLNDAGNPVLLYENGKERGSCDAGSRLERSAAFLPRGLGGRARRRLVHHRHQCADDRSAYAGAGALHGQDALHPQSAGLPIGRRRHGAVRTCTDHPAHHRRYHSVARRCVHLADRLDCRRYLDDRFHCGKHTQSAGAGRQFSPIATA
jgi:hypothetical protein